MRNIKGFFAVFAFALLVMSLPVVASAQWGGNNRDRDRDRDDDYGRNNRGGYNRGLETSIDRLKRDSKDFEKFLDNDLDRSRWDDRRNEDRLNRMARDFKNAADRLEDKFDSRNLNRSSREAQNLVNLAKQLDRELRRVKLSWDVQNYWNNMQRDVNQISNAYRGGIFNRNSGNRFPFPF